MSRGERLPDIMEVISDLSNDEVRTPPKVANQVLDLLPAEVWENPNYRWLDPGAKSGVFLREATRRLMSGLVHQIPDEELRLKHILTKQMFGIGVTELSAMMSRRALYCSKDASGAESAVKMLTPQGNVWQERVSHPFKNGRCSECGAGQEQFGELLGENHAYGFIHENGRNAIAKEWDMKFDVIVGNPPYQMDDVGGHRPVPLYQHFVDQAIQLQPRFVLMITPSRWMAGGLGLADFRRRMLSDSRLRHLVDIPQASEVFPQVTIKGGVSYFLWDRSWNGPCRTQQIRQGTVSAVIERDLGEFDVLVREVKALPILRKVLAKEEVSVETITASVRPFVDALRSNFKNYSSKQNNQSHLQLYMNDGTTRFVRWVDSKFVTNNQESVQSWKVFLPVASSGGQSVPDVVLGKSIIGPPGSVCTETYLAIGKFDEIGQAKSLESYLRTRFARFLVLLRKPGQHSVPSTFRWVPNQTWDRLWTDDELFKLYKITKEEQDFIESMVKEMPAT